ncbi:MULTISPECIES: phage shock protein PspA [unclassified Agarivorans]|uniref:phage shock protein PspA n=1 Tax=unclassified Agarivorans TaxID=2636026 RepID=UPI0026E2954F|nr:MULTISPECIES: phage shock protein PspA [unclassified Agarivorans]MDO6684797.1 phage shock protein PspA [Agarivorans sp. 3_MG-2023]MDO6715042.1 phage shock protein PspA [Agarivorans sp. 2_MG-2023]MDO6764039.1 phage shock protein PspA [Agarivorans sp. 1_MG-2023]
MGMFTRLADIINANISAMLDKAEDPQKMLRLIIQEMEDTLVEVRASTAKVLADKKQLIRKIQILEQQADDWQGKAELALSREREDLARLALVEKKHIQESIKIQQHELSLVDDSLLQLQQEIEQLELKLTESRNRQAGLLARQTTAKNRHAVRQQLDNERALKTREKFEQFQAKIDQLEAKAEVLGNDGNNPDLNKQFAELSADAEIAEELSKLKAKLEQQ